MKKLALAIGHGPRADKGAENDDGTTELIFNRDLAQRIAAQLYAVDVECIIVHRVFEKTPPVAQVNATGADFTVELHCNSYNQTASGTEMIIYPTSSGGRRLATIMQRHIVGVLGLPDRGVKGPQAGGRGMAFLRNTNMPAVIAEPFFIDNNRDLEIAQTRKDELAAAYAAAFLEYAAS